MNLARAAELQVMLEGVPLPARREQLLDYARRQDAKSLQLEALRRLPGRLYSSLDEVGEQLVRVQPPRDRDEPHRPRASSGAPPGGGDYTNASPESGAVRESA